MTTSVDLKTLFEEYVSQVRDMQLATVEDGVPWICTVYFVADEEGCLYWTSSRDRAHSRHILVDSRVAATVVLDRERKRAIQIQGCACEVLHDDLERVHALYQARFGKKDYDLEAMKKDDPNGRAYWVLKPTDVSFWDEVAFPGEPKQAFLVNGRQA